MKFYFSVFLMLLFVIVNAYSQRFTVNGAQYNGQKLKVYPNSESVFDIRFTQGNVGRAESSNSDFTARSVTDFDRASNTENSSGTTVLNTIEIRVFVTANSSARINSTAMINLIPMLSSGNTNYPFFEVVLSPVPAIKNIELTTADIKNLQKGLPIRLIISGTGLDDVELDLPKGLKSKIVKASSTDLSIELSSSNKSYKGMVIDKNSFKVKSANAKVKFDAKKLDFSTIK